MCFRSEISGVVWMVGCWVLPGVKRNKEQKHLINVNTADHPLKPRRRNSFILRVSVYRRPGYTDQALTALLAGSFSPPLYF